MISAEHLGRTFGPYTYPVERERIRLLAASIGEHNPIYHDLAAAQTSGLPDLPALPTLATCYGLWANSTLLADLEAIGAPLPRMLHGEQHYTYHAPVYAGDTLTATVSIVGLDLKRGQSGSFELLTLETQLHNQHGELAIIDRLVTVVRAAAEPARAGVGRSPKPTNTTRQPGSAHTPNARPNGSVPHSDAFVGSYIEDVRVGMTLNELAVPPLEATDFIRYATASDDYNPIHVDDTQARSSGLNGVIAHGMILMGHMGRIATALAGIEGLRAFSTRFRGQSHPGDALHYGGTITSVDARDGQGIVTAELWATIPDQTLRASASIVAALRRRG